MKPVFDLASYLKRIGYAAACPTTLKTLEDLHYRHALTIPFENLNPLLGWPVNLDEKSLQRKLIYDGRGGYCFEQNLLFRLALQELGFQVTGLAARVLWNSPPDSDAPRGHMLLLVDLGGERYIADVGFGGLTLTAPLRLEIDIEQRTPHETFRLIRRSDCFVLQAKIKETWKSLYSFDLQPQLVVDYEVTNWYLSNNPSSPFVAGLMAARPEPDCRYALRNNELAVHHLDGGTERCVLTDVGQLQAALRDIFHINLPGASYDAGLQRLIAFGGPFRRGAG